MILELHKFYKDIKSGIYFVFRVYGSPEIWADVVKYNAEGQEWSSYTKATGESSIHGPRDLIDLVEEVHPSKVPLTGWPESTTPLDITYNIQSTITQIYGNKYIKLSGRELWVDNNGTIGLIFPIEGTDFEDGHAENEELFLHPKNQNGEKQFIFYNKGDMISGNGLVYNEDGIAPYTESKLVRKIRDVYPIYAGKYLTNGGVEVEVIKVAGASCRVRYPKIIPVWGGEHVEYNVYMDGRAPNMPHSYDLIRRPDEIWDTSNTKPKEPEKPFDLEAIEKIMKEING